MAAPTTIAPSPPASPTAPAAPAAPATASSVAQRYSTVAQHLKALEQAKGNDVAADLWPAFLRIRINDAMSDPAKRDAADALLRRLDDQIAERAR